MPYRDHSELVDVISRWENGEPELAVYATTWPHLGKAPKVMWQDGSRYSYLPPGAARRFAAALIKAAEQVEREPTDA